MAVWDQWNGKWNGMVEWNTGITFDLQKIVLGANNQANKGPRCPNCNNTDYHMCYAPHHWRILRVRLVFFVALKLVDIA